jgi:hypothetical protein
MRGSILNGSAVGRRANGDSHCRHYLPEFLSFGTARLICGMVLGCFDGRIPAMSTACVRKSLLRPLNCSRLRRYRRPLDTDTWSSYIQRHQRRRTRLRATVPRGDPEVLCSALSPKSRSPRPHYASAAVCVSSQGCLEGTRSVTASC